MSEIKTLNFFGENGITSTSANHVANLAKEMVRSYQEKLAAVTFYDETIGLIGNREQTKIHSGLDIASLLSLPKRDYIPCTPADSIPSPSSWCKAHKE